MLLLVTMKHNWALWFARNARASPIGCLVVHLENPAVFSCRGEGKRGAKEKKKRREKEKKEEREECVKRKEKREEEEKGNREEEGGVA